MIWGEKERRARERENSERFVRKGSIIIQLLWLFIGSQTKTLLILTLTISMLVSLLVITFIFTHAHNFEFPSLLGPSETQYIPQPQPNLILALQQPLFLIRTSKCPNLDMHTHTHTHKRHLYHLQSQPVILDFPGTQTKEVV